MSYRALLVEDACAGPLAALNEALSACNFTVFRRKPWREFSSDPVGRDDADLVIANAASGTPEAAEFLQWLRNHRLKIATLAILPANDLSFFRLGADAVDEFLLLPFHTEEFRHRTFRLLGPPRDEIDQLKIQLLEELAFENIAGSDPVFRAALSRVTQFAKSSAPVLLNGETGTGKELCARAIHMLSARRNGPFIPVECGAVPETLFENELFGHSRGAYTGAHADQKGLVAMARGGTLFLDEIDGLTPGAQGKLLRLLQDSTFRPLGSEKIAQADVRIVAASNADLSRLVEEKRFRADLFYRLSVLRIEIPPLRRRSGDIGLLARKFVEEFCAAHQTGYKTFSPAAMRNLEAYHWPGNVRELYNTVHRAVLTTPGASILPADLEIPAMDESPEALCDFRSGRTLAIEKFEAEYVRRLLARHNGNVTRAAREAGKERRAFGRLVKKYTA